MWDECFLDSNSQSVTRIPPYTVVIRETLLYTLVVFRLFPATTMSLGPAGAQLNPEEADNFEDIEKQFAVKGE